MRAKRALVGLTLISVTLLGGCQKGDSTTPPGNGAGGSGAGAAGGPPGKGAAPAGAPGGARPPAAVEVFPAIAENVIEYREFTGRTLASHHVEIRPRVSGYLEQAPSNLINDNLATGNRTAANPSTNNAPNANAAANAQSVTIGESAGTNDLDPNTTGGNFQVLAKEGDYVEAGTPLFLIDQRPYLYALEQARGSFLATQAQQERNSSELVRLEKLKLTNAISDSDLELARANVNVAQGQLETLRAAVQRAELDLEFTQIRAPISGYIGRSLVMRKNIVAADTTILTTIVSSNPIHVHFELDESSYLLYRKLVQNGELPTVDAGGVSVSLGLSNEVGFPHQGHIDFADNTTDPNSGNTLLRAEFTNDNRLLAPGLFCRVRVPMSSVHEAVLVPTKCLAMDQQGKHVMVVGPDNMVARRTVVTGGTQGKYTIIRSGVQAGENVVYEGLQKVRDRAPATPVPSQNVPPFESTVQGA